MIKVKIAGLKEMQAAADQTSRELLEAEQPAAMAAGEPIRDKWKDLVPVLDGNYRDSLIVTWLGKQGAAVGTMWLGHLPREDQPLFYAKRHEFGDSIIPAQPSARPALAQSRAAALEAGAEPFRSVVRGRRARKPRTV